MLRNLLQRGLDGAGYVQARALRRRAGSPITPAQPDGARDLSRQEFYLRLNFLGSLGVTPFTDILQVLPEIEQLAFVILFCLAVEHLPGISEAPDAQVCLSRRGLESRTFGSELSAGAA